MASALGCSHSFRLRSELVRKSWKNCCCSNPWPPVISKTRILGAGTSSAALRSAEAENSSVNTIKKRSAFITRSIMRGDEIGRNILWQENSGGAFWINSGGPPSRPRFRHFSANEWGQTNEERKALQSSARIRLPGFRLLHLLLLKFLCFCLHLFAFSL